MIVDNIQLPGAMTLKFSTVSIYHESRFWKSGTFLYLYRAFTFILCLHLAKDFWWQEQLWSANTPPYAKEMNQKGWKNK